MLPIITRSKRSFGEIDESDDGLKGKYESQNETNILISPKKSAAIKHEDEVEARSIEDSGVAFSDESSKSQTMGCRGDPRMNRAVLTRLQNPQMSLLDALIAGGFEFPDLNIPGKSDRNIFDKDNVVLCQRKNQLSRRLRQAKKRQENNNNKVSEVSKSNTVENNECYDSSKTVPPISITDILNPTFNTSTSPIADGGLFTSTQTLMQMLLNQSQSSTQQTNKIDLNVLSAEINNSKRPDSLMPKPDILIELSKKLTSQPTESHYLHSTTFDPASSAAFTQPLHGNNRIDREMQLLNYLSLAQRSTDNSFPRSQNQQQSLLNICLAQQAQHLPVMHEPFPMGQVSPQDLARNPLISDLQKMNMSLNSVNLDYGSKLKVALSIYDLELPLLMRKCLILAGFDPSNTEDNKAVINDFVRLVRNSDTIQRKKI